MSEIKLAEKYCPSWERKHTMEVHQIPLQDTRSILFKDFYQSFLKVEDLLYQNLVSTKVIIVCRAGVNRSSVMAAAYAITRGMKCKEAIEYLADRKFEVSPNWDNLTNIRFRAMLRQLQSRCQPSLAP